MQAKGTSRPPTAVAVKRRKRTNAVTRFLASVSDFDLLSVFDYKRPKPRPREVHVNVPLPAHSVTTAATVPVYGWKAKRTVTRADGSQAEESYTRGFGSKPVPAKGWIFQSNQVLTSKYNVFTFLPRNLLEQFRRVANIFFLVLVVLQFFPRFTTVSPGLSALPLIVVLALAAIKDGYEDLKRHQSDRAINGIKVLALRGSFHNPNQTKAKAKSFGIPNFISNLFFRRRREEADEEADEERSIERKKGFWGKRKIQRPTISSATKQSQSTPEKPDDKDKTSGGLLSVPGATDGKRSRSGTNTPQMMQAPIPEPHERAEGDYYHDGNADGEGQAQADGAGTHPGEHHLHAPHLWAAHKPERAEWYKECWEDLKVGDFVRLHGDESVPADIIVCATSEEENVCYVETKNLDGETNLKSRNAIPELTHLRTSSDIANKAKFVIEAEAADVNMFTYNAAIVFHDGRLGKDGKPLKSPVTINTVLLRGTVVRNTDWVIGVVVMTGQDTKIVLNSGGTPSKRSKVERQMNPMVFVNLFLLALMCTMCAIVDHYLEVQRYPQGAPWLFDDNRRGDNPSVNGIITFANAMICFQNIVPISLYISIEFVRLLQAFFIFTDDQIVHRSNGTKRRTVARSWNLSDDLGQIEYIFSDKTGTLTQNAMLFRQCSIGGIVYVGDDDDTPPETTVVPGQQSSSSTEDATRVSTNEEVEKSQNDKKKTKLADQVLAPFHDQKINSDLSKPDSEQGANIYAFFSNLALCHTVLAADEDGLIAYKAQSPDEAALVQAAADVGFVFLGRDRNILRLQTPTDSQVVEYELLNVIEFSSSRKRMSVIVRRVGDDDGLMLLTKGADNIIFERLAPGNDDLKKKTDGHLEDFANEGLRTLCLAFKPLSEEEYDVWDREYHEAETLIEGREAAMEKVAEKIENNLHLLGATAIEDRLQDGVPEAIADLKRAGLKIWVATGDKLETAIAIGKTCNLLSRDMNLIIIKGGEYGQPNSAYSQMRSAMVKFFNAENVVDGLVSQPPDLQRSQSRAEAGEFNHPGIKRTTTGVSGISEIVGHDNGERPGGWGLVIDGSSLRHCFAEEFSKDLLLELATRCRSVVCCRVSPLQKALIVRLVKDGLGSMCLAIGDGANDVSMIQAADIGVGVAGEEGLQAVNSSDYAIGQFRFLKRLLLVHGHWSYMRNANMIVNFFYKEIIGIGILFWFQFYCGYSATTVYEYTYLLFWNVIWTIAPVIAIGVFDRNIPDRVLMLVPELYRIGSMGQLFGLVRFSWYMLDGIYQSAVIYFIVLYAYDTTTARKDGWQIDLYEFSTIMAIAAVYAASLFNGINTRSWNWWVLAAFLIGPVIIILYSAVYAAFAPGLLWTYVYGYNDFWWESAYFYLTPFISIVLSLAPRYIYRFYKENYYPSDVDILAWVAKRDPNHDWDHDPYMPKPPPPAQFGKDDDDTAPLVSPTIHHRADSFQLDRVLSSHSVTHDMSTGATRHGFGRGFGFDQEEGMLPAPIRRYTSRGSEASSNRTRPRKGSVRVAGLELNPFLRSTAASPQNRARSGSLRQALFGRRPANPDSLPGRSRLSSGDQSNEGN